MTTTTTRRGFTLIEVMVAITIMGAIMLALYTVLYGMLDTRDQLEHEAKAARLGPEILDVVEADLRRAWVMNILDDKVFKGESRILGGEHADGIAFLSTVDSITSYRVDDRDEASDLCETGYQLRVNPELTDVLELWRRQSLHVDDEPLEGGTYERLHDRVVSFKLRYYDRIDRYAEPYEQWDASELHRLPAMVELILELEVVPRTIELPSHLSRTRHYRRMVTMLPDSELAMRIHPLPPTFQYAGGGSSGGGQGPGSEDDEGNPDDPDNPEGPGGPDGPGGSEGGGGSGDPFGGGGGGGGTGGNTGGEPFDLGAAIEAALGGGGG